MEANKRRGHLIKHGCEGACDSLFDLKTALYVPVMFNKQTGSNPVPDVTRRLLAASAGGSC